MADKKIDLRMEALNVLLTAEKTGDKADGLLKERLDDLKELPKNQRAFFNRLTKGTIEQQIKLDHILNAYLTKPITKLKPAIRWIFRISAYQLLEMPNVPASAVVNEAVKLTQAKKFTNLKGLVNAVLRSMIREPEKAVLPDESDRTGYISVRYSMPEYLVKKWLKDYGFDTTKMICESFLEARPVVIRIKQSGGDVAETLKSLENEGAKVSYGDGGCGSKTPGRAVLTEFDSLAELTAFKEGKIYVQDTGSQIAVAALDLKDGMNILDMCAAPGGKSMTAADTAGPESKVTSRDVSKEKTDLIDENIARCGFSNISTEVKDASVFYEEDVEKYDVVIADVPCSGYGVIGRKPDIKYHASKETEDELIKIQRSILTNAVRYIKPGGQLLFSTCTLNKRENEENADWLKSTFSLSMKECKTLIPGSYPGDGFFVSVFTKEK